MGLFWKNRKTDILPKESELGALVTNYTGRNANFKINSKLVVPENYEFVIGKKAKVTDRFISGEHFITYANLPYTCRRFDIDRLEDGKHLDSFRADGYFVDKNLHAGKFRTYRKVEMGTRAYGIFKMHVYGMYTYRVINAQEFMQSLLNEFDYIKTGEAEDILENWVSDLVVETLERNNFVMSDVVANSSIIADSLKLAIGKMFTTAGLEIVDLKIYKYKLPKKLQAESDKNILEQQNAQNVSSEPSKEREVNDKEPSIRDNQIIEEKRESDDGMNIENDSQNELKREKYVPFGNFVIEESDDFSVKSIQEESLNKRTFVDLDLNKLYDKGDNMIVRCPRCGAQNDMNANTCTMCGEVLKEDDL